MFTAIITVDFPLNRSRVKRLQSNLKRHGMDEGKVFYGEKAKTKKDRNNLVFKGHRDVCEWFIENTEMGNLLILEDDAYICSQDTNKKIKRYIRYLDKNKPDWFVLSLGCIATSNMVYVDDGMYNGGGYAAHSYVINRKTLKSYIDKIPSNLWKAPECVECWHSIPKDDVYMLHPMLFTQDIHISWYYHWMFPGVGDSCILPSYINSVNSLNINKLNMIFVIILIVFIRFKF
jgi:hypothetical protein